MTKPNFSSLAEAVEAYEKLSGEMEASSALGDESATKIASLTQELTDATAKAETLSAEIATLQTDATAKADQIAALQAENDKLKSEAATAEQRAAEIAANAGTAPVSNKPSDQATMTRNEFEALSLKERIAAIKAGTKITD